MKSAGPIRAEKKTKAPKLSRYSALAREVNSSFDPNRVFVDITTSNDVNPSVRVVDLFSGAGGMSQGLRQAGFVIDTAVELVEIAAETHRRNFPESSVVCGDIKDYVPKRHQGAKRIRLVVGGPPCQGFSVAGRRDPSDPRNRLFREFVRVVEILQPDYFVMENVPGILTMQNGAVKDAILEAFEEIGYSNTSVAILEAASFGVAQLRSRAIFIGNRHGLPNPFPAPLLEPSEYLPIETAFTNLPDWERIPEINHEWTRHSKSFTERISRVTPGGSLYETFMDAYKRQYQGVPSMTIKENHGGTHIHPTLDRCISAREMARLQSFPDNFVFAGPMKKAMWQIGNAVPPLLAEAIGRALAPFLEAIIEKRQPIFQEILPDTSTSDDKQLRLL